MNETQGGVCLPRVRGNTPNKADWAPEGLKYGWYLEQELMMRSRYGTMHHPIIKMQQLGLNG
jgi:hypothetical protein